MSDEVFVSSRRRNLLHLLLAATRTKKKTESVGLKEWKKKKILFSVSVSVCAVAGWWVGVALAPP